MDIVDSHCHLSDDKLASNLDSITEEARKVGIVKLITCAVSPDEWDTTQTIAERYSDVEFALGIHPWFVKPSHLKSIEQLHEADARGAKAIGEIGLDNKIETPDMALQSDVFERQLIIAKEIGLPVVIHCRSAFDELLRIIKRTGLPEVGGMIHAYSGSVELAEEFIKYGMSFSLGASLTYRNSNKRIKVLKRIFPDHMLLETDSPDMPPVEMRGLGKPNLPENILYNLRAAAETLNVTEKEVAEHTAKNAQLLFNLEMRLDVDDYSTQMPVNTSVAGPS